MGRGFNTAISGLSAAQMGLTVVGHNMSNVYTEGYTRQKMSQDDFMYSKVGVNANGNMKIGLGTNVSSIKQVRNEFLDRTYRTELSTGGYYDSLTGSGLEVESIIGELQSDYNLQSVFQDVWDSLNELSMNPDSVAARATFISACVTFIDKINDVDDRLYEYQKNLNEQVIDQVARINTLSNTIFELNQLIADAEISGDNANDYRDLRNNALDELSLIADISYRETDTGKITVQIEGHELVNSASVNTLGLKYTVGGNSFVEPVFTNSTSVLAADTTAAYTPLFNYSLTIGSSTSETAGTLKGLIVSRGMAPANYTSTGEIIIPAALDDAQAEAYRIRMEFNMEQCLIPQIQNTLDTLVNAMVDVINDAFSPMIEDPPDSGNYVWDEENAPYDLEGNKPNVEIFTRLYYTRYDDDGNYIQEVVNPDDPTAINTLYTMGNLTVNPDLLSSSTGYNYLATSLSGDIGDNELVLDLLEQWKTAFIQLTPGADESTYTVDDAYNAFVNDMAITNSENYSYYMAQQNLVLQTDNDRLSYSGVSLDEEMTNMMVYQHSYNAASRLIVTIDEMIETVITMKR